jgi:hypothetical protein
VEKRNEKLSKQDLCRKNAKKNIRKYEYYENAHASVIVSHRERARMQLRMDPHKLRSWTKFRT